MTYKNLIQELFGARDFPISIDFVNSWLFKNGDLYNQIIDKNSQLLKDSPFSIVCKDDKWEEYFLSHYSALAVLSNRHKYEYYFKDEVNTYMLLGDNIKLTESWVSKNYELYNNYFVCFEVDYLDYSTNAYDLQVYVNSDVPYSIKIKRACFKNTIKFLTIFNKTFYELGVNRQPKLDS